ARARANGIELCYDTFGDANSPALLLIMGLASQMIAWPDEFCALLAARGYRVIRFDNRDIGLSTSFDSAGVPNIGAAMAAALQGKPVDAPYRLSDMGADAFGLLDALGIESAHVVGASMGGAIAQTMAIERPGRLRTLTSIMATTGAPGLPPPTPEAMAVLLKPPATTLEDYVTSYAQTWKVLRAGSFPEDEALDHERAERLHARGLNPPGVARQLAAILASGSRKTALGAVRVPTLVIHGDADPLVPLACGVDTAQSVAGARLVVVEGMGHALPISHWGRIIDAIAAHAV
ncbi:MAG TPA: alpha/beta hydrolase, partial [Caldimonas sp.]